MPDLATGWTAVQVRNAEQPLLDAGEPLMQRAAAGLAAEVERLLAERDARRASVLVLVGSGNNGGDALFAAATLAGPGHRVILVPVGTGLHEEGLDAAVAAGAQRVPIDVEAVATLAAEADVVVDGILGTGAASSPALRPPARDVVAAIIALPQRPPVVAVDLPSGVGADDGSVHEPVLPADVTVTFGAVKAGLLLEPARSVVGRVVLVDLGVGPHLQGDPAVLAP